MVDDEGAVGDGVVGGAAAGGAPRGVGAAVHEDAAPGNVSYSRPSPVVKEAASLLLTLPPAFHLKEYQQVFLILISLQITMNCVYLLCSSF